MAIGTTAVVNFVIIVIIGILTGLAFTRYARGWLARFSNTNRSDMTSALVGIAGAFMGFHVGVILGLLPSPLMFYLSALVGAVLVLWLWRGR